jgi:hypothetical protein
MWRNVQKKGLVDDFNTSPSFRESFRRLSLIPFVPLKDITVFKLIKDTSPV